MNALIIISLLLIAGYCFFRASKYNQQRIKEYTEDVAESTGTEVTQSYLPYSPRPTLHDIRTKRYPYKAYSYLTGLNYEGRQAKLKKFIYQETVNQDKYQGLTGKDLREQLEYDIVWEYDFFEVDIELVPEPDNQHDSNAIAVYADIDEEEVKLGYIPSEDNEYFLDIMDNFSCIPYGTIKGGKFKELDWDNKIKVRNKNYSMDITLWYDKE